jgi:hypothetical protein
MLSLQEVPTQEQAQTEAIAKEYANGSDWMLSANDAINNNDVSTLRTILDANVGL